MTESSDAPTARPQHGRRARRLTSEEAVELETRASQEALDQTGPIPPLRGAVAAPPADAPVPKLRKFGRRARIVEIVDAPDEVEVTGESEAVEDTGIHEPIGTAAGAWGAANEDTVSVPVITDDAQDPRTDAPSGADDAATVAVSEGPDDASVQDSPPDDAVAQGALSAEDDAAPDLSSADASATDAPSVDGAAADVPAAQTGTTWTEPATDVLTAIRDEDGPRATETPVVAGAVLSDSGEPVVASSTVHAVADDGPRAAAAATAPAAGTTATLTRTPARDVDGVELGELKVGEAPNPRPAPRFDGKVLHRPERTGSHQILWLVWVLIALAVIALVVLLVTGVIGGGVGASADAAASVPALLAGAGLDFAPWRGIAA